MIKLVSALWLYWALVSTSLAVTPFPGWEDSYSADGQCYCITTFDHDADQIVIETLAGPKSVVEVCEAIGPGPGVGSNPIYNDLQCGNGPPNSSFDETACPGRVDMGEAGCDIIGPTWNLDLYFPDPSMSSETPDSPETPDNSVTDEEGGEQTETQTETSPVAQISEPPVNSELLAASSFSSKDNRWNLLAEDDDTAAEVMPLHFAGSTNGSYLKLLPDDKVVASDPSNDSNVWPQAGDGPQVHFDLTFQQAGTYEVFARTYSTGDYDAGLAVGVDGIWSETDNVLDTCGIRDAWVWSNCDESASVVLSIPTGGVHTIQFSALNDGVEFDQFAYRLLEPLTVDEATPELARAVTVGEGIGFGAGAGSLNLSALLVLGLMCFYRRYQSAVNWSRSFCSK